MYNDLYEIMNWPLIEGIEYTDIDNPHTLLGPHMTDKGLLIQTFIPEADDVKVKYSNKVIDMCKMDDAGFYAVFIDSKKVIDNYKFVITKGGNTYETYDSYAFEIGTDLKELKKFNAGIHYDAYDYMGSKKCIINKTEGIRFRVWAPEAIRVSVVGEFNNWDGRIHQMSRIKDTGIFEIFIPELKEGQLYKYEIKKKGNENILKADPFTYEMEENGGSASVVKDINGFKWTDDIWLKSRDKFELNNSPLSIYQMSVGNFSKDNDGNVNYKELAKDVADYVLRLGYTHVELMPLAEYYNDAFKPDFIYAPTNRYGKCEDLMAFVDYLHSKNIGVIIDLAINQFSSEEQGIAAFDGTSLFEHANPKRGYNYKNKANLYNYGRPEVTSYLIANAFMQINKYHFDGIKLVNVASMLYLDYDKQPGEWEPNIYGGVENLEAIEFIKHFNSIIHKLHKGIITIADDTSGYPELTGEVSETCLGFDLKLNTEWRKDFLNYISIPAYMREKSYNDLSLSMVYQYSDNYIVGYPEAEFINGNPSLLGRMTGDTEERKFDNMKLTLAYEYVHPGKKVLFMGQDMAQYAEWLPGSTLDMSILKIDKHKNINAMVKDLNDLYKSEKALFEYDNNPDGFEWINNISARESILTFLRKGADENDILLVACNFDAVDREEYKIGVPKKGKYKEIFNSNNKNYGGNGFVNSRLKQSKTDECDGREESIRVNVPALSISIFKFTKVDEKLTDNKAAKANVSAKKTAAAKKPTVKKATETKKAAETKKAVETKKAAETKKATTVKKVAESKKTTKTEDAALSKTLKTEAKTVAESEVKAPAKSTAKTTSNPEVKAPAKSTAKTTSNPEVKAPAKSTAKATTKTTAKTSKTTSK